MKDLWFYNASDFSVDVTLTIPPNQGFNIEDLIQLANQHGGFLYLSDYPNFVDADRILPKEDIQAKISL